LVLLDFQRHRHRWPAGANARIINENNIKSAITGQRAMPLRGPEDRFRIRPGRVRSDGERIRSFVGQVKRATERAGGLKPAQGGRGGRRVGRGRAAALGRALRSSARRVVVKARIVRHGGSSFRAAPLARHIAYLAREGVTQDGQDARLFDAAGDDADAAGFAARIEGDRHHFRFIVSPEDADQLTDLRAFTRELMDQAAQDLGVRLDWVAVDHWNTGHPHIHVLVRGRTDDGADLVISRDYISRGLRARAERLAGLELGPRSEHDITLALRQEVGAERWTGLDRTLRALADENAGVIDLRPGSPAIDPTLQSLLVGRTQQLERLGLAEAHGAGFWSLKPGLEPTLRALADRGDIIRTLHQLARDAGRPFDPGRLALHDPAAANPVVGRLVARGLHDELRGEAFAVIDGLDGRTHHLRFADLERTSDAHPGAVVERRVWTDERGKVQATLAVRSDLTLEAQIGASGATWLDRQLVSRPALADAGFGAEVRAALDRRAKHLVSEGLARRAGQTMVFAPDLLGTLRRRELAAAAQRLARDTGLEPQPLGPGEAVAGVYRRRLDLASGRFAMIDNGLGFQLVPWRAALEPHLGGPVRGTMTPAGGVDWRLGRQRGLGL
jgi:type IV secretory pathway VirD2 relaxase